MNSSLVGVAKDSPGLIESGHNALIAPEVGVMQAGKPAIGGLDCGAVGIGPDSEHVVVVSHRRSMLDAPSVTTITQTS